MNRKWVWALVTFLCVWIFGTFSLMVILDGTKLAKLSGFASFVLGSLAGYLVLTEQSDKESEDD